MSEFAGSPVWLPRGLAPTADAAFNGSVSCRALIYEVYKLGLGNDWLVNGYQWELSAMWWP